MSRAQGSWPPQWLKNGQEPPEANGFLFLCDARLGLKHQVTSLCTAVFGRQDGAKGVRLAKELAPVIGLIWDCRQGWT